MAYLKQRYPLLLCAGTVWLVWVVFNFTDRVYYASAPGDVVWLWLKIRALQGFNGFWATLLLFAIYDRLVPRTITRASRGLWVLGLIYLFSLGLVLVNMTIYRYYMLKSPLWLNWDAYFIVAFSKCFVMFGVSVFYFLILHWKALQVQREKTLSAVAVASEAQLQMLRYQLNPHFFFNALNSIRTLVYEDPGKADRMITDLSDFLRSTLATDTADDATLTTELEIIRNYLQIQKIRFEDRLEVAWHIDPDALSTRVPCFLVHPLVENAVKYGLQTSAPPLQIAISAAQSNGDLAITVSNSGRYVDRNGGNGTGTGLKNVRARMAHFFPEGNLLQVTEDDGWVHARIHVQAIHAPSGAGDGCQ